MIKLQKMGPPRLTKPKYSDAMKNFIATCVLMEPAVRRWNHTHMRMFRLLIIILLQFRNERQPFNCCSTSGSWSDRRARPTRQSNSIDCWTSCNSATAAQAAARCNEKKSSYYLLLSFHQSKFITMWKTTTMLYIKTETKIQDKTLSSIDWCSAADTRIERATRRHERSNPILTRRALAQRRTLVAPKRSSAYR